MKILHATVLIPLFFVIVMWIVYFVDYILPFDFAVFGIYPRESATLLGILTTPIVHGSFEHLLSNTFPIFILGTILFITYNKIGYIIWTLIHVITGILVWLFARGGTFHIGASGVVYGVASFLFFSGLFRFDIKAIAIASMVAIFYGGMIWGVLPIQEGVSWESHLFGGITGAVLSYLFKNVDKDEQQKSIELEHSENLKNRKTFDDFIRKL